MYEAGDFLFTQIGPAENAISAVTEGFRGARVNHLGIVVRNRVGDFVLEAFPPEVRVTSLPVYLRRSNDEEGRPRYIHSRIQPRFSGLIPAAIRYGLERRNTPYDAIYLTDELALYCSELVVDMFRYANGGIEFFMERPMSFRDRATGQILPYWVEYYRRFGMNVPEGEPGSNPGDISRDERLDVISVVGPISGYQAP